VQQRERRRAGTEGTRARQRARRLRLLAAYLLLAAVLVDLLAALSYGSDKRYFRRLAGKIAPVDTLSRAQLLERFVSFAYSDLKRPRYEELPLPIRLYYRFNPFHPSARDVVEHGCDYRGGCGSSSRVLMALLDAAGIENKSLILLDEKGRRVHAVVSALVDGKWAVADPLYGIVFKRRDGTLVSAEELKNDPELFEENVRRNPSYPKAVFRYENFAWMNWNKIPVILPALRWILERTIGEKRTASIARPRIWMYPAAMFAVLFTFPAVLGAAAAEAIARKLRRRDAG